MFTSARVPLRSGFAVVCAAALATAACSAGSSGSGSGAGATSSSTVSLGGSSSSGGPPIILLPDAGHPHDATQSVDAQPDQTTTSNDDAGSDDSGSDDSGNPAPDSGDDAGGPVDDDAGADASEFTAHGLPIIPDHGGPVMAHPLLVSVTYANDPQRAFVEQLDSYLVTSPWLAQVGPEYGVGLGTHVAVELPGSAPTTIDDVGIQALVESLVATGTAPDSDAGLSAREMRSLVPIDAGPGAWDGGGDSGPPVRMPQIIYMMFFPATTTLTVNGSPICDVSGGGYHGQTALSSHGQAFAYGVITQCPNETQAEVVGATSHELIEASTDPSQGDLAYSLRDPYIPWSYFGGEVGDLCSFVQPQWSEGGFTGIQRVYSNAAAAAGGDPCLPAASPYYGSDVTPRTAQGVNPGSSVTYDVVGWSSAPVADWELSAELYINEPSTFVPTFSVSTPTINSGTHATMTVNVPAGTAPGSYALGIVFSSRSQTDYTSELIEIVVQ